MLTNTIERDRRYKRRRDAKSQKRRTKIIKRIVIVAVLAYFIIWGIVYGVSELHFLITKN